MGFDMLAAAIQSVNLTIDTVKAISTATGAIERAELKFKVAEMMESLAEAKLALVEGIEERDFLQRRIASLEEAIKIKDSVQRLGDAYYTLNEDGTPTGDPYCSSCWETNHNLIHLISAARTEQHTSCAACKTKYPRQTTLFDVG